MEGLRTIRVFRASELEHGRAIVELLRGASIQAHIVNPQIDAIQGYLHRTPAIDPEEDGQPSNVPDEYLLRVPKEDVARAEAVLEAGGIGTHIDEHSRNVARQNAIKFGRSMVKGLAWALIVLPPFFWLVEADLSGSAFLSLLTGPPVIPIAIGIVTLFLLKKYGDVESLENAA